MNAAYPGRAVAHPGDPPRPGPAGPVRVGVRAVQRPHRAARQPRRGRAARPARHLPELLLRAAPAAVRGGRLRLPRVGPDDRQRHQRQADPAAGRRRAVRRALRRAARPRAGPRPAGRHARPRRATGCRPPARRSGSAAPGWSRSPSARSPRSATRSSRSTVRRGSSSSPSWSPTSSCRPQSTRPAGRRRAGAAAAGRGGARPATTAALLVHRTKASGLRMAAGDGARGGRAGQHHDRAPRAHEDWARTTVAACSSRARRCGWSSSSRTAGPASARCPALRDQVGAALAGARLDRLGRAASRRSATYLDEFWDAADVEVEGDPEVQQAVRFGLFHVLQAGARAERRPIAGQGPHRPRLRRARVLGHRDVRAAGADLHPAGGGRRRAALAALHPGPGPGAGADAGPARARRSRGGPSGARSARRTGRPAPPRFHIGADIADAVAPLRAGHRRRATSSARSAWSCWSRPPGCGARWATTTGTAGSTSTA